MSRKTLLPLLLASVLAGSVVVLRTAEAALGNIVTECIPFQPYPRVTHQKCTEYYYSDDGRLVATFVYYVDERGVWYILPY